MKKIMMVLAVVATAIGLQAAQVTWKLTTGATYGGMNVYAFTGSDITSASIAALLGSDDSTVWASTFAGKSSVTATTGNRGMAQSTSADVVANDNLVFVILNGAVAEGTDYYVLNSTTIPAANIYTPPTTPTTLSLTASTLGVASSGTFASVPEPTSGLMLLLGMAGLALKRKKA